MNLFVEDGEELSIGSVELRAKDPSYNPEEKCMHSLERVRDALEALETQTGTPMLEAFAHMLAFDAWIGNSDRHQENWGVLRSAGVPRRLAPVFDVASCLGVEFEHPALCSKAADDLVSYAARCPSGFGDGSSKSPLLSMLSVVEQMSGWPEWSRGLATWLADFRAAMDTFEEAVRSVPVDWLAPERAALACSLLRTRLEWLGRCGQ